MSVVVRTDKTQTHFKHRLKGMLPSFAPKRQLCSKTKRGEAGFPKHWPVALLCDLPASSRKGRSVLSEMLWCSSLVSAVFSENVVGRKHSQH